MELASILTVLAGIIFLGWMAIGVIQFFIVLFVGTEENFFLAALVPVVLFNIALPIGLWRLALYLIGAYVG